MNETMQVGAGVVIIQNGRTLLAKRRGSHAAGCYGSLGGHVEFGERPVETVKREAREELGIEIGNIEFVSCTNMRKYGKHYVDLVYRRNYLWRANHSGAGKNRIDRLVPSQRFAYTSVRSRSDCIRSSKNRKPIF